MEAELNQKVIKQLKRQDSYGFKKLDSEYTLNSYYPDKALTLRLPDVIGPWDDTGRFWKYIFWL